MTRRSRARARDQARPRDRASRSGRPVPVRTLTVLALVLVAIASAFLLVHRNRSTAPPPLAAADSLEAMDAHEALVRAAELDRQGRHVESLPYFRRAAAAGAGPLGHWDYAAAMNNVSIEVWRRNGVEAPATRSSIERIELVRAALSEVRAAGNDAVPAHQRAALEIVRGRTLERWGFTIEALEAYRAARALEDTSRAARQAEADCIASLRGARAGPSREP